MIHDPVIQRLCILVLGLLSLAVLGQLYMEAHFPIYDKTLRFHVRAASDDVLEQRLKLMVRDSVLREIRSQTDQADTARELEDSLRECQTDISRCAEDCLREQGHERNVKVYFTKERFPIRRYGAIIFPAGLYHALRVDIGEGKGHNWWCALYPQLCYNSKEIVLSEKGKKDLRDIISGGDKGESAKKAAMGFGEAGFDTVRIMAGELSGAAPCASQSSDNP